MVLKLVACFVMNFSISLSLYRNRTPAWDIFGWLFRSKFTKGFRRKVIANQLKHGFVNRLIIDFNLFSSIIIFSFSMLYRYTTLCVYSFCTKMIEQKPVFHLNYFLLFWFFYGKTPIFNNKIKKFCYLVSTQ